MTEDQIERVVERTMDRLDRDLLNGELSQEQYDAEVTHLDQWATEQYKALAKQENTNAE